jgi:ATP-dependent Lon protease
MFPTEQEGESRRRHEAVMAQMAIEREKKLMELDQLWRQKVRKEEMQSLRKETVLNETLKDQRKELFQERETDLLRQVQALHGAAAHPAHPSDGPHYPSDR